MIERWVRHLYYFFLQGGGDQLDLLIKSIVLIKPPAPAKLQDVGPLL